MTPPSWPLVPARTQAWVEEVCRTREEVTGGSLNRPLPEALARLPNEFEKVHPFLDGDGRTGRLVLNRPWDTVFRFRAGGLGCFRMSKAASGSCLVPLCPVFMGGLGVRYPPTRPVPGSQRDWSRWRPLLYRLLCDDLTHD